MVSSSLPAYQQFRSNKNAFLLPSLSQKKRVLIFLRREGPVRNSPPLLSRSLSIHRSTLCTLRGLVHLCNVLLLSSPSLLSPVEKRTMPLSRRVQPSRGVEHNNRGDAGFLRIPHSLQGEQALSLSLYHPSGWTMEFSNGTLAIFLLDVEGG